MKRPKLLVLLLAVFAIIGMVAIAQDDNQEGEQDAADQEATVTGTIQVAESENYGWYLTDAEGYALYTFVQDEEASTDATSMTEGVRETVAECTGGCLEAWPPLTVEGAGGEVIAGVGAGIEPQYLYTAEVSENNQVVYNGYPLYRFANDAQPGDIGGQGVQGSGGTWYLVSPEGALIRPDDM